MRLTVTFDSNDDFVQACSEQLTVGGLLIPSTTPPELQRLQQVEVHVSTPAGSITVPARVLQVLPSMGVAVEIDPEHPGLGRLLESAQGRGKPTGRQSQARPADTRSKIQAATVTEKMQMALHGSKEERSLLLREPNVTIHQYVLRNPKLQLDEVAHIAGNRTMSPEILKVIGSRREWFQRPDVATALLRNPKTPVPLAVRMVDFASMSVLRQLSKSSALRPPVLRAVRKKVLR